MTFEEQSAASEVFTWTMSSREILTKKKGGCRLAVAFSFCASSIAALYF